MIINSKLFKKAAILFGMCAIVFCMATGCTPDRAVNGNGKAKDKYAATAYGWWRRTPGAAANGAAVVDQQGNIDYYGHDQASDQTGVRPVIQVSLTP